MDFGTASLRHGSLEQEVDLDGFAGDGEAPTKRCPQCDAEVPMASRECPLCGYSFAKAIEEARHQISDFVMTDIDLLKRSNFAWCDLFGDDRSEEHTSELQSLMRISYAVFCLKKKKKYNN